MRRLAAWLTAVGLSMIATGGADGTVQLWGVADGARLGVIESPAGPLPSGLRAMPNPCAGVPANPWCPAHHHGGGSAQSAAVGASLALIAVPAAGWRLRRRPRVSG